MSFLTRTLLTAEQIAEYAGQIEPMSDDDFTDEMRKQIRDAGYESRHSAADQRVSACYAEAQRRDKIHLYGLAYNGACRDVGVEAA